MHRLLPLCLALTAACGSSAPVVAHPTSHAPADANDVHAFASASNDLGLDVWEALRASYGAQNLAISPASISTALAMTYGGARGATATAMASAMHFSSSPDDTMRAAGQLIQSWNDPSRTSYELAVANRLFGAERFPFADAYLAATRDEMGAELERLDFSQGEIARGTINAWVSDRTHARIPELLPPQSVDDASLVLVNAVYFHGRWQTPFDASLTTDRPFHTALGDHDVPSMACEGGAYGEDDGVQLLALPYAGDELSMLFVLPRDPNGLAAIESRLDDATVQRWAANVHADPRTLVHIPRFRIETDALPLGGPLAQLGMSIAFSPSADFSGMTPAALHISAVYHRVFVELNEEGTEAAAATGAVMNVSMRVYTVPPTVFDASHPFLFFLRETSTGAILFAGRVVDPA